MNNKGKGTGITLILLLIVALIVAYLAMTQMGALGFGRGQETQIEQTQDLVDQAQDIVDQINEKTQQDVVQEP